MNDIVITGATGVIGRRAVSELVSAGHRVAGVTRSAEGARLLESLGARAVEADVFDPTSLATAFAGSGTVVNLLTHIPAADRMATPGAWDENDRLRREASAAVAVAAGEVGAERLIQESIAFVYADGGDRWLDEDAPVDSNATTATVLTAEANASKRFAGDAVVLRFGLFIGPDSHLSEADVKKARRTGVSPSLGARDAYRPTLWLDDAGTAVAAAVRAPASIYNVGDGNRRPARRSTLRLRPPWAATPCAPRWTTSRRSSSRWSECGRGSRRGSSSRSRHRCPWSSPW